MITPLHRSLVRIACVSSATVVMALGQQAYDFIAQGQRFHNARIESIGNDGRVFIHHAEGTTAVHGALVPKQLYDAYYAALEAAKKPKDSFAITAKIIQMQDVGALANISIEHTVEKTREREVKGGTMLDRPYSVTEKYSDTELTPLEEPVFLYGLPSHLVDGDTWSGIVFLTANYRYTTVSGATKKVRAFATSRELADEHRK